MFGFFKHGDEVTSCCLCVYFVHCMAHFQHESVTNAKITTTSVGYLFTFLKVNRCQAVMIIVTIRIK